MAAVRPSILTLSPFSFSYAHGRYALTGHFLYRANLVALASRDHGLLRVTCHRSAYSLSLFHMITVSRLCLPFVLAGLRHTYVTRTFRFASSRYALCYPDLLVSPVLVTPSLLPDFLHFTRLDDISVSYLYDSFVTRFPFTFLCTCISQTCIYTGLEMGRSPSSIYFATTLVL